MANKDSSPRRRVPTLQSIPVATPDLSAMHDLIAEEMTSVTGRITEALRSRVALVDEVGHYIVEGGGKRLRPSLVILSAQAYGYRGRSHIDLAAIIEFIHTATLLHDDVVDESVLRRGKETANAVWGNDASVLVGDFLYSRSFQMMVEVGSMRIMELLADTTNAIAEGEVQQLLNCHNPDTSEAQYLEVIRYKTAKLFEAAAQIGPVLSARSSFDEKVMARYGLHLGTAYQLVDDVLDYRGSADEIGKNVGDDLAEGKPTLPLIHAIKTGTEDEQRVVRGAIRHGGLAQLTRVVEAVESTGAIAYTARKARAEADLALEALDDVPPSPYRDALELLAEFAVSRTY